jgi:hypothetical protein
MYVGMYIFMYVCIICVGMFVCMHLFIYALFNVAVNSQLPVTSSSNRLVDN